MKTGDSKQVIALGVVAFIAIAFLGKTAFGAFGGENAPRKVVVQDLKAENGGSPPQPGPSQTTGTNTPPSKTESDSHNDYKGPAYILRDAFAKPPSRTQSFPGSMDGDMGKMSQSSPFRGGAIPPVDPDFGGQVDTSVQSHTDKEPAKTETKKTEPAQENVIPKAPTKIRFDGFVDAGNPMAVISIDNKTFSIGIGEALFDGYKVETISSDKITVRKNKDTKTLYIGRETEF